jgi:hypothetical protein
MIAMTMVRVRSLCYVGSGDLALVGKIYSSVVVEEVPNARHLLISAVAQLEDPFISGVGRRIKLRSAPFLAITPTQPRLSRSWRVFFES